MTLKEAQKKVAKFTVERAWDNNLPTQRVMYAVRELSRVAEHTMFMEGMTTERPRGDLPKLVGDSLFSVLCLANRLGIDIEKELVRTMALDAVKYPPPTTKASSLKALKSGAKKYSIDPDFKGC